MIQLRRVLVLKYWLYSDKQKNQICETLDAYLRSWIQGHIQKIDRETQLGYNVMQLIAV